MNEKKIKVYFVLPTLFAGGAERIMSFVAQNLCDDIFEATLIVIGFEKDSKYNVQGIPIIYLNKSRVLNGFLTLVKIFMKEKPNIVISSISHLNSMMGLISIFFYKIKFVGRHATIQSVAKNYRIQKQKKKLKGLGYLFYFGTCSLDYIICQSYDMKSDFLECHNYNPKKIEVIQNPITKVKNINVLPDKSNEDTLKLITIGRFRPIKGQLRLLDVLGKLKIPFVFTIIGEGEDKEKIFNKIRELNLENRINYIPHTNNVYEHLIKHDFFLQGSYSEGFPNTLLESCTVGTPVIAFDAPGGTREIIENGVNGYIVKDQEEFLEKLNVQKYWDSEKVIESVYNKFSPELILSKYKDFFIKIINSK